MNAAAGTDEKTVHRVEAFSDIVIGFSLAQLGASLTLKNGASLDPLGVFSFLFAFGIVCSLWFFHHRLFQSVFAPAAAPLILNFIWLAVVVLLVFVAQQLPHNWVSSSLQPLYYALYAAAYAILALQAYIGLRRGGLAAEARESGRRQLIFMTLWTLVFTVTFITVSLALPRPAVGAAISLEFTVGALVTVMVGRRLRRARAAGA